MRYLVRKDIPFKTVNYTHPLFNAGSRRAVKAGQTKLISEFNWNDLPWPVRAALKILGSPETTQNLTVKKVSAAIRRGEAAILQKTGRTADDLLREFNDFLSQAGITAASTARIATPSFRKKYLDTKQGERRSKRLALS